MPRYTKVKSDKGSSKIWKIFTIIAICLATIVGGTLAYFFADDWSSNFIGLSGKVDIIAIGNGNISIEDDFTTRLEIILDGEHTTLIPNMPIQVPANVKVYRSTTKPLIRAKLDMQLINMDTLVEDTDNLSVCQNLYGQLLDIIENNNWYLHTDSFFYYVGDIAQTGSGGDTLMAEVDATEDDTIVNFINQTITFPKYVTSDYSGLGVKFIITFQAIQNYIPDDKGYQMANTVTNSLKIFNHFDELEEYEPTPVTLFDVAVVDGKVTIGLKDGVTYPETIKLPTEDANGNKITNISASFADIQAENIVVPAGYTTMDEGAFRYNKYIKTVDLSQTSIDTISHNAFRESTIETVHLPNTIKSLSTNTFRDSELSSIVLPEGLEIIGDNVFNGTKLSSLYIPASVRYISEACFIYSPNLKTIIVDDENENYYDVDQCCVVSNSGYFHVLASLSGHTEFTVPDGVKTIYGYAFNYHPTIEVVNFPASMELCGYQAFKDCKKLTTINALSPVEYYQASLQSTSLLEISFGYVARTQALFHVDTITKLIIEDNVTTVEDNIIAYCSNLEMLIFESSTPPEFASNRLHTGNLSPNFAIYVPDDAVNTYKAVPNLANYVSYIKPISQLPA